MRSGTKHELLLISITLISLFLSAIASYGGTTTTYIYDELNRLKRVEYTDGTAIEYTYDKAGNRQAITIIDTGPPQGSITAPTSTNSTTVPLTLNCTDNIGCYQMQFSNDNITWSGLETYAATKNWTLRCGDGQKTVYVKYKDAAENWSPTYQVNISLITDGCTNSYVKVESASFCNLQEAYDHPGTVSGTIQSRAMRFTENLTIDRDIAITFQGGYDCNFSTYTGNSTSIKGMITTTAGGGTLTIRNFILEQ